MSAVFIMIGASLLMATGFLVAFIRAAKSGQYDDDYTPSVRILFDDETTPTQPSEKSSEKI
jgi:cbb3-type cytochrome oxidase maturation protein